MRERKAHLRIKIRCTSGAVNFHEHYALAFLLLGFSHLGPLVAQRHRPIEYKSVGRTIRVSTEIAKSLELIALEWLCVLQRRLNLAVGQHFKRIWIQIGGKILALRYVIMDLFSKKVLI